METYASILIKNKKALYKKYRAEKFVKLAPLSSRLYCWCRNYTDSAANAGRGLYRQWGITPRPEELLYRIHLFSENAIDCINLEIWIKDTKFLKYFRKSIQAKDRPQKKVFIE